MATASGTRDQLSDQQIAELASEITATHMETIAAVYLGLEDVLIKDLREQCGTNVERFKRDILHRWKNKNSNRRDQAMVCNKGPETVGKTEGITRL